MSCWLHYVLDQSQTSMRDVFRCLNMGGLNFDISTFSKASKTRDPACCQQLLWKLKQDLGAHIDLDLLKDEYFFVQKTIEDYNKQIWGIKALGLTGTGAAIGLMLEKQNPLIALIGCAIPLLFWILES